jgi:hypothetical protein
MTQNNILLFELTLFFFFLFEKEGKAPPHTKKFIGMGNKKN